MRMLLLGALTAGVAYYAWAPKPLDGTVWEVSIRRSSILSWPRRDILVFDGGRLTVTGPLASGRSADRYSTRRAGDATHWNASLVGPEGEAMSWQGAAKAGRIEGAVIVTDGRGKTRRLAFAGSRRP